MDEHLEAVNNTTDINSDEDTKSTGVDVADDAQIEGVAPENAEDEIEPPQDDELEHTQVDSDSNKEEQGYVIRSNRISRPHDKVKEYPGVYYLTQSEKEIKPTKEANQYTSSYYTKGKIPKGRYLRLYYIDDNYEQHLADGDYYSNQYFIEGVNEIMFDTDKVPDKIKVIKKKYQHYLDALKWMDVGQHDIVAMMFAAKKMSI